ncbi:hypothetical protein JCM1393_27920 [Clostridium carnis]
MKEIKDNINLLKETITNLSDGKNKEIFSQISSILVSLSDKLEETIVKQEFLEENVQYMDEDITDLQEELFEEVSFDDLNEIEDEYIEITCTNCKKPFFVEKDALDNNKLIPCPFCSKNIK